MIEAMKSLTEKQVQRIENKKKKLAAFLEIAKLNDLDREVKTKLRTREDTSSESSDGETGVDKMSSKASHGKKKRIKTHHDEFPDSHCLALRTNAPDEKEAADEKETVDDKDVDEGFGSSPSSQGNGAASRDDEEMPPSEELGPSGKPKLVGEEFDRLRAELRQRKKLLTKLPLFRLRMEGEQASIDVKEDDRTPLFLSDIQHLLLYSLIGTQAPYSPFAWCQFEKHNRVSHTVVLVVEGLSLYDYLAHASCFPRLAAAFSTRLEVITPSAYSGNFVEELALIPMTHNKEISMIQRYGSLEAALRADGDVYRLLRAIFPVLASDETEAPANSEAEVAPVTFKALAHNDRFPRTQLIMSPSQLIGENFPLPLKGALKTKYQDYILTKDLYKEATPVSPMFALDCEMCLTTAGAHELTRISIVDEELNCLYDTLVLPYNRIVNYLTRYSGITAAMLEGVTKRLEDVQVDLRNMLPMDAILVGQSLNSDLHTLKMMHPYVIDTSVIYNVTSDYRRKTKLSTLSLRFLGEKIQNNASAGHCSTEDSEACMKLVQLKLANSLAFGDTILASYRPEYRSLTQPEASPNSTARPTCYIKFDDNQSPQVAATNQPTIYQYYPVAPTTTDPAGRTDDNINSGSAPAATEEKPVHKCGPTPGEHLATSLFSHLKKSHKTVGIVSTPEIIDEYSRWINGNTKDGGKRTRPPVDNVSVADSRLVYAQTAAVAPRHAFTIGHVRYDEAFVVGLDVGEKAEAFMRGVDAECGRVWDAVAPSGLCIVVFGGRRGGANGACFVQIKRAGKSGTTRKV